MYKIGLMERMNEEKNILISLQEKKPTEHYHARMQDSSTGRNEKKLQCSVLADISNALLLFCNRVRFCAVLCRRLPTGTAILYVNFKLRLCG